ncbi:MAG: winged helix-turn-helix domain-containing protein [Caldilineaceae bacterium]
MSTNSTSQPTILPSKWAEFPATYRQEQVATILRWIAIGESGVVVGASGTGKSNIAGYIANRRDITSRFLPEGPAHYCFLHLDINSLPSVNASNFYRGLLYTLQDVADQTPTLAEPLTQLMNRLPAADDHLALHFTLQKAHELLIRRAGKHVVWLIDRFDTACQQLEVGVLNSLRNLRDRFKEQLSYVVFTRAPLARLRNPAEFDEFHEIVAPHTCWVGAMNGEDARWVAQQVINRYRKPLNESAIQQVYALTGGWPDLMKAGCSALASGELTEEDPLAVWQERLLGLTNSQRSCRELWNDCSAPEQAVLAAIARRFDATNLDPALTAYLSQVGLLQQDAEGALQIFSPLFEAFVKQQRRFTGPLSVRNGIAYIGEYPLPADLTMLELRLLDYLIRHAGQNCDKQDLVAYVWPDEKQVKGIRDDSLAQLKKRLCQKIEPGDKAWTYIETVHGRGYRLNQPSQ